jgi:hypothetical protein
MNSWTVSTASPDRLAARSRFARRNLENPAVWNDGTIVSLREDRHGPQHFLAQLHEYECSPALEPELSIKDSSAMRKFPIGSFFQEKVNPRCHAGADSSENTDWLALDPVVSRRCE